MVLRKQAAGKGGPVKRIAIVAAAVLIGTACGGDTQRETFASTPQNDLADAITEANGGGRFDDETTACIAQGVVDEFGEDGLAELGVTPENPDLGGGSVFATQDTARRAVDVGMGCIDVSAAINDFLPADVSLLDETVDCLAEQLQSDTFRDLFAELISEGGDPADILNSTAAQIPIATLLVGCLSPEEFLQLGDLLS